MPGKLGEHARILTGDQVGRAQHVEGAQRDIAQVADRRGDNMQPGLQRRFTRRLPAGSLVLSLPLPVHTVSVHAVRSLPFAPYAGVSHR
jgi:hypothetical protein